MTQRRYASIPLPVSFVSSYAVSVTSPAAGASLPTGTPVTITGFISPGAIVVQVKLGASILGSASINGSTWSYTWTPQVGDIGAQTIGATATFVSATAQAPGITVTVAAAGLPGPLTIMAGHIRAGYSGDVGLTGTSW